MEYSINGPATVGCFGGKYIKITNLDYAQIITRLQSMLNQITELTTLFFFFGRAMQHAGS